MESEIIHIKFYGEDNTPLFASILGTGTPVIILHGGGPDRQSIIPFANLLKEKYQVIFPDIRGYGESICLDPSKHTWEQYASDVISLIDQLGLHNVVVSGMGLGASITERVAYTYPDKINGLILISPETLDEDGRGSSKQEIDLMDKAASVAISEGLKKAWEPFLNHLAPVIKSMVIEAIPRTNAESFAAAMAIVHSQRLKSSSELSKIAVPALIIPGNDSRHDSEDINIYKKYLPQCIIVEGIDWNKISTVDHLALMVVPSINDFLIDIYSNTSSN